MQEKKSTLRSSHILHSNGLCERGGQYVNNLSQLSVRLGRQGYGIEKEKMFTEKVLGQTAR